MNNTSRDFSWSVLNPSSFIFAILRDTKYINIKKIIKNYYVLDYCFIYFVFKSSKDILMRASAMPAF